MPQSPSVLTLRWRDRLAGAGQTPARFLDFVVDGTSLHDRLGEQDAITPLLLGSADWAAGAVDALLLRRPGEIGAGRQALYVCPECGDLGCGARTAIVEQVGDRVVWRDFAHYTPFGIVEDGPSIGREGYEAIGPFSFDAAAYEAALAEGLAWLHEA